MADKHAEAYWKSNIKIVSSLLVIWFLISFGCGILLVDLLDSVRIGGFKLGFWIAQQGAIFVFVVLIFIYIHFMNKLDDNYESTTGRRVEEVEGDTQ